MIDPEVVDSDDDVVLNIRVKRVPRIIQCPRHNTPELKNGWSVDVTPAEKYVDYGDGAILLEALLGATQRMLLQCHDEGIVFTAEGELPRDKVKLVVGTTEDVPGASEAPPTTIH